MAGAVSPFPDDTDALKALLTQALQKADDAEQRVAAVEAELANARALASATEAMIAHLKLQNAKLRGEQHGPSFLAVLVFDTYGQYHPLHRQAERFACEGALLSVLTLADQIGTACHALMRIYRMIEAHVLVPSAFMAMTPPCWSWPKARPISAVRRFRSTGSRLPLLA
ncbi:transposase [Novosphingobium sp. NDB2Meth1]|jgi:hypothetical protein|uniref:IS66 family transposase n=1 Tax=Novosphingobium sp. NDB2Meth1 TaxID=1892847 RepID=UPI00092FDFAC|nr:MULTISPECIES: transposase [unclassified Novosphingobium]